MQTDAQTSITEGAVSGAGHIPSDPGEAPNNDTGVLANNIETLETGPLKVTVSSNAPYAAALEFGSSREAGAHARSFSSSVVGKRGPLKQKFGPIKVEFGDSKTEARPYMSPALEKNRDRIAKRVAAAVNQANRMK